MTGVQTCALPIWHKNKNTKRFIEFGEEGTQEKYHFAESWKTLTEINAYNFIRELTIEQQNLFKKRMQNCIYATDMGRHVGDLGKMKDLLKALNIQSEKDELISEDYKEISVEDQQ